ncbi:MAG: hypothetical protein IJ057_09140 [Bacteroidales bacterium]|nr:hypothetical protein [Bacteroidales bacterium]
MKININGNEVEAYALIMRKENALEILRGTKTVELRAESPQVCEDVLRPRAGREEPQGGS